MEGCWDNVNLPQNDEESNLDKDITEEENGMKTFRVKDYIPKRSTDKYLKIPYIIGVAIIFTLVIIIIVLASLKNKSVERNCPNATVTQEVILNLPADIILLDKNHFFIYDPRKGSLKLLHEVKNPVQSFDIDARKTLFCIEANSSNIMSLRQSGNKTGKDIDLIFDEARVKPFSIAVDSINNNLYILDESIDGLIVINTDTKYYALLMIAGIVSPRYIVTDAEKGIVFIASTKLIMRADMDGILKKIVDDKVISAIALDPQAERIYWIDNDEAVKSCNYLGLSEQHILLDSVPILDITILDDYLFWLRKSSGIQNTTLWSCKIQNGTCQDHAMMLNDIGAWTSMRVTGRAQSNQKQQNSTIRQKCEHISLAAPNGQATCVCNMSSQLVFNKKCEPVTQFVLYTIDSVTRSRTLDISQKMTSEPFWPTPYRVGSLAFKTDVDFDYDFENGDFYFSDDKRIYKINLKGKSPQQETVLTSSDDLYIEDLAYDWLTGNMYYSKRSKKSTVKHSLVVFNVKKGARFQKTLKYFDYDSNFGMEASAYGLAVYPSRGILFFTAGESGRRYIYQTTMNGTVITKFTSVRYVHEYRLIAVDYDKDRLYWISSDTSVTHANFDGSNRKDISKSTLHYAKTISINRQWMYLNNQDSVWRVNKETAGDYSRVSPSTSPKVSGARIINQAQVVGNPCRKNNGGCEQFCFYGSNATCDCADGSTVTPQGACT